MKDRKLASIQVIKAVQEIPDADKVQQVWVNGWSVVVSKTTEYRQHDPVLFFEIDSFIDVQDERFAFLADRGVKTNHAGEVGHVVKTIRLKKTYSQGLILPLGLFPEITDDLIFEGSDVTELLGIKKWEPPIPADLRGTIKGLFPSWVSKTSAERVQNLGGIFPLDDNWVATEKIDGTSVTYILDEERNFRVCSRNLELKKSEGNVYWRAATLFDIEDKLKSLRDLYPDLRAYVLQGEIFGEGINKNPLGQKGIKFVPFNLQLAHYLTGNVTEQGNSFWNDESIVSLLPSYIGFDPPPFYRDLAPPQSIEEALAQVEGLKSLVNPERQAEGIVWWRTINDPEIRNFKAINNKLLLKEK